MEGLDLGGFRILRTLGTGGMGTVYEAHRAPGKGDVEAGPARVALKVLHPHLGAEERFVERFAREGRIGQRVRHPCVVAVLETGRASDAEGRALCWLAMEYVEGQTLADLQRELGKVPEGLCRRVAHEIARGLEAIHAEGIVHRDVKPANVLITRDEEVKILDLGVARLFDEAVRLSETGTFVGSLLYAAPEQFRDRSRGLDGRVDLHALGLLLYELSTGVHPYEGVDLHQTIQRLLTETPRPPSDIVPELSAFFDEVVLTLLAKDPAKRFASASECALILSAGETASWWREREALRRAQVAVRIPRVRVARDTALIGREAQLLALLDAYGRAEAGTGQVHLVEGEPGGGKSRLVDAFLREVAARGVPVHLLFGAWPPGGAASGFDAFFSAVREHFGDEDLERGLAMHLAEAPRLVEPLVAALRGLPPPQGAEPLTREALRTAFVHLVRSLARERPVVFAVDDLHFAAEEGRALFAALAHSLPEERVLLLGAHRPELPTEWLRDLARLPHVRRLRLPRLTADQIRALLAEALGSEYLAQDLAREVVEKADGNPFFVFELLRGLQEGGHLLRRDDGSFVATRRVLRISMPATIRELVARQLEDLEPDERDLLDVAACCGHEFDPALVGEALGLEPIPTLKRLARLETARGLVRSAGRHCLFEHQIVQEVLHEGLPRALRAGYHAALGEALARMERVEEKDVESLDGMLCVRLVRHGLLGGQSAAAVRYLDRALDALEQHFDNEKAVEIATLALETPGALERAARLGLLLRKAGWLDIVGRRDEQRALLAEALALTSADPTDRACGAAARARVLAMQAALDLFTGLSAEAQRHATEARDLARESGAHAQEVTVLGVLGTLAWRTGAFAEAARLQAERVEIARASGLVQEEVEGHMSRGLAHYVQGQLEEALGAHELALGMAQVHGLLRVQGAIHSNIAITLRAMGRQADAEDRLKVALAVARETGDRRAEANITGNLGNILGDRGRWKEALRHHERQRRIAGEVMDRRGEAISTLNAGLALIALGRPEEAAAHVEQSARVFDELGDRRGRAHVHSALSQVAEARADLAGAVEEARLACQRMAELGVRGEGGEMLVTLGRLLLEANRPGEAVLYLDEAISLGKEMEKPGLHVVALALRAQVPGGDAGEASRELEAHERDLSAMKRTLARHALWRATGDPSHLESAQAQLVDVLEHADPEDRARMVARVPLFAAVDAATDRA